MCRKVKRNVSGQELVRFKNHVSGRHRATGSTFDPESRYILDFLFLRERSYKPAKNRIKKKQIVSERAEEVQFMSYWKLTIRIKKEGKKKRT